jgi:hypothetical protein
METSTLSMDITSATTFLSLTSSAVEELSSPLPASTSISSMTPQFETSSSIIITSSASSRDDTTMMTSTTVTPTCPISIPNVALSNTITATLTLPTFPSFYQERFIQITKNVVNNYCSLFKTTCSSIKLSDVTNDSGSTCVIITNTQSRDGETMVTFFVTLNDGTLLVPVDALKEAVQVGINNGDYQSFAQIKLFSEVSTTLPSQTVEDSKLTSEASIGIAVVVVIIFIIILIAIVLVVVMTVLMKRRNKKFTRENIYFGDVDAADMMTVPSATHDIGFTNPITSETADL